MAFRADDLKRHCFRETDSIFVDTCIWYLIHGPYSKITQRKTNYSSAIRQAIAARSKLFVDGIVISEFANLYLRTEFQVWKKDRQELTYKDFRGHDGFNYYSGMVTDSIKRILEHSTFLSIVIDKGELIAMLDTFAKHPLDLNDLFIEDQCKRHDLLLLTDDGDYKDMDIRILTCNEELLT